jgi:hypothetical protein
MRFENMNAEIKLQNGEANKKISELAFEFIEREKRFAEQLEQLVSKHHK